MSSSTKVSPIMTARYIAITTNRHYAMPRKFGLLGEAAFMKQGRRDADGEELRERNNSCATLRPKRSVRQPKQEKRLVGAAITILTDA